MTEQNELFRRRASVLSAMANPARLHMVDLLTDRELCVGDLSAAVGQDISTVSRHLVVLRNAGLVRDRKEGNRVFYSLAAPCITDFFECIERVMNGEECTSALCLRENSKV